VKLRITCLVCTFVIVAGAAMAQQVTDVLGVHNLTPGSGSPLYTFGNLGCTYCHAPHSGLGIAPLWNQTLSTKPYTNLYTSAYNTAGQPPLGSPSNLCLSCHDGTVGVGQTVAYGTVTTTGSMSSTFGTDMTAQHPVSLNLPINPAPDLVSSLTQTGQTLDPAVQLIKGNVECTTCHNPHVQSIDPNSPKFLVRTNSNSEICLACHDVTPGPPVHASAAPSPSPAPLAPRSTVATELGPRLLLVSQSTAAPGQKGAPQSDLRAPTLKPAPTTDWARSAHATAPNRVASKPATGHYATVSQNGCLSCHVSHNGKGPDQLLRGQNEQACAACHSGGANVSPAPLNVFAEFSKGGHPFPDVKNAHSRKEDKLLNQNRHATCADCHNGHSSKQVASFGPAPRIRDSQFGVTGISATDGVTAVAPAANQYENCLRCHGKGSGKQTVAKYGYSPIWSVANGDPLDLLPQFNLAATSSHPVMHDRDSGFAQPSLLPYMWNLDGRTQGRPIGTRILCTDCHNADDNREFGGSGPNGPHGSKYSHILERRYEFSQVAPGAKGSGGPGSMVQNLYPNPILDPASGGPYSLCAKCHDLNSVISNSSFSEHARHINDGFSCSVCHTAHGMGSHSASISGERLVNFDINVVAPNGAMPISYNRATNSCSITCHNHAHSLKSGAAAARTR
jgi:predicted CXXCH cytochrome family protein